MINLVRLRGCLLGLATGDALGTTVEFRPPGTFEPLRDMVGGGPFHLKSGEWTDDTSMALCLAESLVERQGFEARDQMERYLRWYHHGHLSSNGRCFDIGSTTSQALLRFERSGDPFSGSEEGYSAGNGSLMRLAPVPMAFAGQPEQAIYYCGESSRTTHGARAAIDACCYYGGLIILALNGAEKETVLRQKSSPVPGYWDQQPLMPEIEEIALGSFKDRQPPQIKGSGYVVRALEAALWAFYHSENFREGCLLAANLGDDADTTAAIYGQLAGAFYGETGIPAEWREKLALRDLILQLAEGLYQLSLRFSQND
jgi:ADP-ribosylglycohydrolase